MHAGSKSPPETSVNFAAGDLVTLVPQQGIRGYHDIIEDGCIRLWSDSCGRHIRVPVGAPAIVISLVTAASPMLTASEVFDVLVDAPGIGPVVVSTFAERLFRPAENP